jgi:hypothetical protein
MQLPTVKLEVERVMNLIQGFGWSKVKEEITEGKIHIEIVKETAAAETGLGPAGAT